jgi:hypothetical protein
MLTQASREAEQRLRDLENREDHQDIERFLNASTFVIEKLESLAVDISRIFAPSKEEDMWRRYHKGDQGVFLRHLARSVTPVHADAIQKACAKDKGFRDYVQSYVNEYESLLDSTRKSPRADVLTALFVGSDLGKVYMVLAKAMGRLD